MMDVKEWKLDIIFLVQVGLAMWLWTRDKRIAEIISRLEELRKLSEVMTGRHSAKNFSEIAWKLEN